MSTLLANSKQKLLQAIGALKLSFTTKCSLIQKLHCLYSDTAELPSLCSTKRFKLEFFPSFFQIYFCFTSVLPACMRGHNLYAVPAETR